MNATKYPHLRFDPARGNVATVHDLAQQLTGTATYADAAHDALMSIKKNSDVWTGDAAKAFAETIEDLPGYLDTAHRSFERAGNALNQWGDTLAAHQQRARELEEAARQATEHAEQVSAEAGAASERARMSITYDAGDPAAAQAAQQRADALDAAAAEANRAAGAAWDNVDDIRRQAEQLLHTWKDDAAACAKVLREAGEIAPDEGFFEMVGQAIASGLDEIADIAGVISTIAGILSFVPGLNFIAAPIALISGAVALGAHAAQFTIRGQWDDPMSYVTLGADLVGVVPGAGALLKGTDEVVDVASKGVKMFADDAAGAAGKVTTSADEVATTGLKGTLNTLNAGTANVGASKAAAVMESTVDATLQVPTVADQVTPGQNDVIDVGKDAATGLTAAKGSLSVIGNLR